MTAITETVLQDDFLEWIKEPTQEKFKYYKPLGDKVLVRLYYFDANKYNNGKSAAIYKDMTTDEKLSSDDHRSKFYSIAKVLAVGNGVKDSHKSLNPGELVVVSDLMTDSHPNDKWTEYMMMLKEKPSMADDVKPPPRFTGYIQQWKDYVFFENKFIDSAGPNDLYTFLLPSGYVLSKYVAS